MKIVLYDIDDKNFSLSYIPRMLLSFACSELNERANVFEDYLRNELNIDEPLTIILKKIFSNMNLSVNGKYFTLKISNTAVFDGYNVSTLARLIEYGNTEVAGLKIISKAANQVQKRIGNLYTAQIIGV